jgi:hypothetical protein
MKNWTKDKFDCGPVQGKEVDAIDPDPLGRLGQHPLPLEEKKAASAPLNRRFFLLVICAVAGSDR